MNHLLIGAAQAPHLREYARSWEQATSVRPRVCGWGELAEGVLPSLAGLHGGLLIRAAAPTPEEAAALEALGGAGALSGAAGDIETAPAALSGLCRALSTLEQQLGEAPGRVRWATPPQALALLLDLELRQRCFERDGIPTPTAWPVDGRGAHVAYEALRERLRHTPSGRILLRLRRGVGPLVAPPTVLLWSGGRGVRAQANCHFTQAGAARGPLHTIDEETELRPLIGRLLELGAFVCEDYPSAELGGRPFVLSLLATGSRVAFGQVGPGGAWRVRGAAPEPGVPRDFVAIRRQIARDLYERIEETCVRLCRLHRCAALVVDVALSRRFDDFRVLDVDPFAELPGDRRDAVGWSAYDHLVRQVRTLPEAEAQAVASG